MKAFACVTPGLILTMLALVLPQVRSAHAEAAIDPPKIRIGPCPGFEGGPTHPSQVARFYTMRTIEILQAARSGNTGTLRDLISPTAEFSVWHGDYGGSMKPGIEGASQLARHIKARRFQVSVNEVGPFAVSEGLCVQELTILFTGDDEERGTTVKFSFKDGILTGARGQGVDLIEGDVSGE